MTEEKLLTEFLATKDREMFAELYERMRPRLYALALRILRLSDDAEDIVEDVFCKLYELEAREFYPPAENFLFRMVRNRSFNHRRKETGGIRRGMISLTSLRSRNSAWLIESPRKRLENSDWIEEPIDPRSEVVEQRERRQELWDRTKPVLEALPVSQREAVELYHARSLTIAETAECLGVNEDTAWTRIRRGIGKVREKLLPNEQPRKRRPYPWPVQAVAVETGTTVHDFPCIKDVAAAGYPVVSVRRALREGKPYKGLKWSYANAT